MVALIRPEQVEAMRKEYVGKKLRVLEDFDTDTGDLKRGDVGTVVAVDDWGRFRVNWLSGRKDLVTLRDPIGDVACCTEETPHPSSEGLDPETKHWIRGVDRVKPIQWGYGPEDDE